MKYVKITNKTVTYQCNCGKVLTRDLCCFALMGAQVVSKPCDSCNRQWSIVLTGDKKMNGNGAIVQKFSQTLARLLHERGHSVAVFLGIDPEHRSLQNVDETDVGSFCLGKELKDGDVLEDSNFEE